MNEHPDRKFRSDAIDQLLRQEFPGAVQDDGFTDRVMRTLPVRLQHRTWVMPTAAIAGGLLAWLALMPIPLWENVTSEWQAGNIGPNSVVLIALLFGTSLIGCWWALEEAP